AVALGVHGRAGAAVDEHEFWPEDESLALHVGAHRHHASTAELVERFLIALDEAGRRAADEQHGPGDDERVLEFFANPFPVRRVREEPFVRLEIFFVLDGRGQRDALRSALGAVAVGRARRRAAFARAGRIFAAALALIARD